LPYNQNSGFNWKDLTPKYDPTIMALADASKDQWGDPEVNRGNLIPFGIPQFDAALYGMDITYGELNLIIGPEKQRKTTMALNIIVNYMMSEYPKEKPMTLIDTLESGMKPEKYKDSLLSIVATKYLMKMGHSPKGACQACGSDPCKHIGINPDFLRYRTRTKLQVEAIDYALETIRTWPIVLYGPSLVQGDTRSLRKAIQDPDIARWPILIKELGVKVIVLDHVQQYHIEGVAHATDYEKQIQGIAAVGDVVSQWNVVCLMLSQISLTSIREQRSGAGKLTASGGSKAHQEANVIFSVGYNTGEYVMKMAIEEARDATGSFAVWQPIEIVSGAFYGFPQTRLSGVEDAPRKKEPRQQSFA